MITILYMTTGQLQELKEEVEFYQIESLLELLTLPKARISWVNPQRNNIIVSGPTVTAASKQCTIVLSSDPLQSGKHMWKLKVNVPGCHISIGVALASINLTQGCIQNMTTVSIFISNAYLARYW
jgi:hypothetical protein